MRVQIHTDFIHAVLNDTAERLAELLLVHIVLILADTDGFRIDFDKLCQRILHTACDGSGASLSDIKVGIPRLPACLRSKRTLLPRL